METTPETSNQEEVVVTKASVRLSHVLPVTVLLSSHLTTQNRNQTQQMWTSAHAHVNICPCRCGQQHSPAAPERLHSSLHS